MTTDQQVRNGLAALADQVRPTPDPYGRLLARRQRSRMRRATATSLAVACVVSLGTVLVVRPGEEPPAGPSTGWLDWTVRLVDAAPRGSVADPGFVADLTDRLTAQNRAGQSDELLAGFQPTVPGERSVRVLFAEDIGDMRVAVAALVPPTGDRQRMLTETVMAWMIAARGADPQTLVSAVRRGAKPAGTGFHASGVELFTIEELLPPDIELPGPVAVVGLAPPGCAVSSAVLPEVSDWRPEPTGSYLVRAPAQRRAEWWRVICDEEVHGQLPARPIADPANPDNVQVSEADVAQAMSSARGAPDPLVARDALSSLTGRGGYALTERPAVVWGEHLPEFPPSGASAVLITAPTVGGGWASMLAVTLDDASATSHAGMFNSMADPRDPTALLAVRLPPYPDTLVLVLAPPGVAQVRAVWNGQTLDQATVDRGAAALDVPDQPGVIIEAVSDAGEVIDRTVPVGPGLSIGGLMPVPGN